MNPPPVIHWFRRDLRLTDNPSLHAAAASGRQVIPVYILSTWKKQHRWTGPRRQEFLCASLRSLSANLEASGARLIIRAGEPVEVLSQIARETGARDIHFNRDVDPHGKSVEKKLAEHCAREGWTCHSHKDVVLHEAHEVLTQSGTAFRVFTPYCRVWMPMEKTKPNGKGPSFKVPESITSLPLPDLSWWGIESPTPSPDPIEAGEKAARARLKYALEHVIPFYAGRRDIPAGRTTSRLGQDLRYGLLSIREVHARVADGLRSATTAAERDGHRVFLQELAWREFYMQILHNQPEVLDREYNVEFRGLPWEENPGSFARWRDGMTGFPIVDAGMRQLAATGFMHNRVRMIVSMFLTKDLHLDWRAGEMYFNTQLLDGEIASNNGGWQWSAGTGADAAPYFRIQNPWSQSKRHDPDGNYIRQWIPELRDIPASRLHAPPDDNRPVARGYPLPMLDHSAEREKTLQIFKRHRKG